MNQALPRDSSVEFSHVDFAGDSTGTWHWEGTSPHSILKTWGQNPEGAFGFKPAENWPLQCPLPSCLCAFPEHERLVQPQVLSSPNSDVPEWGISSQPCSELRATSWGPCGTLDLLRPRQTSVAVGRRQDTASPPQWHCHVRKGWLRAGEAGGERQLCPRLAQGPGCSRLRAWEAPGQHSRAPHSSPAPLNSCGFLLSWLASEKSLPKVIRVQFR